MKARSHPFMIGLPVLTGLLISVHAPSLAQSVFKCTADGKTVYQSSPCVGQGKELAIAPGPSEQEIQSAKTRANAERAGARSFEPPVTQRPADHPRVGTVDCAKLNQDRADAFGRRNGALRTSKDLNIDQSGAVDQSHNDIRRIESKMVQGGCKPT